MFLIINIRYHTKKAIQHSPRNSNNKLNDIDKSSMIDFLDKVINTNL